MQYDSSSLLLLKYDLIEILIILILKARTIKKKITAPLQFFL